MKNVPCVGMTWMTWEMACRLWIVQRIFMFSFPSNEISHRFTNIGVSARAFCFINEWRWMFVSVFQFEKALDFPCLPENNEHKLSVCELIKFIQETSSEVFVIRTIRQVGENFFPFIEKILIRDYLFFLLFLKKTINSRFDKAFWIASL